MNANNSAANYLTIPHRFGIRYRGNDRVSGQVHLR